MTDVIGGFIVTLIITDRGVEMITRGSVRFGTKRVDGDLMKWSIEDTLRGDLIVLENDHNKIMALVDDTRMSGKVKLLQADNLNYEWVKELVLEVYRDLDNKECGK